MTANRWETEPARSILSEFMRRFRGLYLHYLYSMRRNPARIIEILIWPSFEALLFGLLASGSTRALPGAQEVTLLLLTGIVYWNCTARVIQESVAQFIDDFMSKNIQNLMISPISIRELLFAVTAASLTKIILSLAALLLVLVFVFPAFLGTIGPHVLLWVIQLELFGVALSLIAISGIFLFGERASFSGWMLSTIVQIFSLVFYDRSVLPQPLYAFSYLVPSSYIFESLRLYMTGAPIIHTSQLIAFGLNIMYLITGMGMAFATFRLAKRTGTMTKL